MRQRSFSWFVAGFALAAVVLLSACDPPPPVLELQVVTTADGRDADPGDGVCEMTVGAGDCSLRAAVDEANASTSEVQVRVAAGDYELTLPGDDDDNAGGDLDLSSPGGKVVLLAPDGATVDATGSDSGFDVRSGTVQVWGFSITGASGPGVAARPGTQIHLVLDTVHDNGSGVDIAAGATVVTHDSTIARNDGPGIANAGELDATFTTITGNAAGGITGTGAPTLIGSIVGSQDGGADCTTPSAASSSSADSDGTCGLVGAGDQPAVDPGLGSLASTTGGALVAPPQVGSPLVDAIAPGTAPCTIDAVDQGGRPRPVGTGCDIGAVEADFGVHVVVDNAADVHDSTPGDGSCDIGDGSCTLRAAVDEANVAGQAGHPSSIELAVDPVLTLSGIDDDTNSTGDLDLLAPVRIDGAEHTIDADGIDRVLDVRHDGVTLDLLTITGGHLSGGGGGAGLRHLDGTLTITRSLLVDNTVDLTNDPYPFSSSRGGAILAAGSQIMVDASTIAGNAADLGGGIAHHGGTAAITNTTFSDNRGGAYYTPDSFFGPAAQSAAFTHVTVAERFVGSSGGIMSFSWTQCGLGGCRTYPGALVTVTASSVATFGTGCSGTTSFGYNVGCGATATDLPGPATVAPALGDFGGPTPTRPSFAGGPGIDLIPPGTTGLCDTSADVDQRGVARPVGAGCDSGAVEGDNGLALVPLDLLVNTSTDAGDTDAGDGVCATTTGACSLRAAVDETNAWPGADTITIGSGVDPVLSLAGAGEDQNASGDLDSIEDLTIVGNGATVDGALLDRVVDSLISDADLEVRSLTVRRGRATGDGGAIRARGPVVISGSTFTDNRATAQGGALLGPTVVVDSTSLSGNRAGTDGGAIRATSSLAVTGGSVRSNLASGKGGGLSTGAATITGATIERNQAASGGGVHLTAGAASTIVDTVIDDNVAAYGGGGIFSNAPVTIERTSIEANRATLAGWGTGGGIQANAAVTLRSSTVADNVAAVSGGGLAVAGVLDVSTSTIHANTAGQGGGAVSLGTPARSESSIRLSTITANRLSGAGEGAGIEGDGAVRFSGSVLANEGRDCWRISVASGGYNVARACERLNLPTDQVGPAPLGPLGDNGGPTRTRLPFAASTVLDAIPVGTSGLCDASTATDQRGVARPDGGACDIGAVEGDSGIVAMPRTFVVDDPADAPDADPDDGTCASSTGSCTLRAAVDEANTWPTPDTITIEPGVNPTLTIAGPEEVGNLTGDLDIHDALTIEGGGATIHGSGTDRILLTFPAAPLTLEDLTLTGANVPGWSLYAGGAVSARADVVLARTTVTGTTGATAALGSKDGVTFTLVESSVRDNATSAVDAVGGRLDLTRSTISGSGAPSVEHVINVGDLSLATSTISANVGTVSTTTGTWTSSTITGNTGGIVTQSTVTTSGSVIDNPVGCIGAGLVSGGHNLVWPVPCGLTSATDQVAPSLLEPLADNGGPTRTQLPYANSPAIDAIPVGTPGLCDATTSDDQRGEARPVGVGCDLGAVEGDNGETVEGLDLVVDTAADGADASPGDGVCATAAGGCSLRAAIDETNASITTDTIVVAPSLNPVLQVAGGGEDANATGDLDIHGSITIDGAGATLDARGLDRALDVHGGSLIVRQLTIRGGGGIGGGDYPGGAAIRSNSALELDRTTITANQSALGGAVMIRNGTAQVHDSSFTGNVGFGGGGSQVAALSAWGTSTVVVERSTFRGNTSDGGGGALGTRQSATLAIRSSTIVGNVSFWDGSAIEATSPVPVTVTGSTIAQNAGPSSLIGPMTIAATIVAPSSGEACAAAVTSGGFNVVSDASCGLGATGDQQAVDPLLSGLADNGGPTRTMLLRAGSPALDVIPPATVGLCAAGATDQRGAARPQGSGCDVGAAEGSTATGSVALSVVVDAAADGGDVTPGDGVCATAAAACTLRAAIDETNARVGADTITIAAGIHPTLSIPGADDDDNRTGDLDVTDSVDLVATDATVSAAQLDRVLDVHAASIDLDGLTIRDGRLSTPNAAGGGVRVRGGDLVAGRLTVRDNRLLGATSRGGGIALFAGNAQVQASTVTSNQVAGFAGAGGGIVIDHGTLDLANSTVSSNVGFAGAAIRAGFSAQARIVGVTVTANGGLSALSGSITIAGSIVTAPTTNYACVDGARSRGGFNILSDTTCDSLDTSNLVGADPLLGALAANGGATPTHLPGGGSPAIDAIPSGTAGLCDGSAPLDQRAAPRPTGAACDIGSVEQ